MLGGLLYRVVRGGFTDIATFEKKPEEMRGTQRISG